MDDAQRRKIALSRIREKRAFRDHAAAYVVVNALLVAIWALSGAGYFWPVWTIAGWGIGLAMHAWHTFGQRPITEDQIQAEMRRLDGVAEDAVTEAYDRN